MSHNISTLLTRNLHDVFGEGDPARRREAVDDIFTEDCVFYEPGGIYRGRDEIDRIAGVIRATHPDFRYTPTAQPATAGTIAFQVWLDGANAAASDYADVDHSANQEKRRVSLAHVVPITSNLTAHYVEVRVQTPNGTTAKFNNQFLQVFVLRGFVPNQSRPPSD